MAQEHGLAWKTATTSFETARARLEKVLSMERVHPLKDVKLPSVVRSRAEFTSDELETGLEKLIEGHAEVPQKRNRVVKEIVLKFFRLSYPCLKVFLTIGVTGSSVDPSSCQVDLRSQYLILMDSSVRAS